jgi:hypothetical protein
MAILTIHHWDEDQERVSEMRRVARGPVVILTFDAEVSSRMWLMADYMPEVAELDRASFPPPRRSPDGLTPRSAFVRVPIARDTPDWTLGSFRRTSSVSLTRRRVARPRASHGYPRRSSTESWRKSTVICKTEPGMPGTGTYET